jgi:hypothetical protein
MGRFLSSKNYLDQRYELGIAEGKVPNHQFISKFGHNSTTGATLEEVWDGSAVYTYPTVAAIVNLAANAADVGTVVSSGTATSGSSTTLVDTGATFVSDGVVVGDIVIDDTHHTHYHIHSLTETKLTFHHPEDHAIEAGDAYRVVTAGGTGASAVEIQGVDATYNAIQENIVLSGATPVPSTLSYLRVFRARVIHAGSAGWNVGNVTITGAALVAQITATFNQTLMALWTVPDTFTAYIYGYYASTSTAKVTEIHLYVREEYGPFQIKHIITLNANHVYHQFPFPLKIDQHSDIKIMASAAGGGGEVSAGFDCWFEID